jgi:hypothetical protein
MAEIFVVTASAGTDKVFKSCTKSGLSFIFGLPPGPTGVAEIEIQDFIFALISPRRSDSPF